MPQDSEKRSIGELAVIGLIAAITGTGTNLSLNKIYPPDAPDRWTGTQQKGYMDQQELRHKASEIDRRDLHRLFEKLRDEVHNHDLKAQKYIEQINILMKDKHNHNKQQWQENYRGQ